MHLETNPCVALVSSLITIETFDKVPALAVALAAVVEAEEDEKRPLVVKAGEGLTPAVACEDGC